MRALVVSVAVLVAAGTIAGATYSAFSAATANPSNSFAAAGFWECDYRAQVLTTPQVARYWRLGESAGTVAADATGSASGTYVGGVTLGATAAVVSDSDTAARFDGVDDRVEVPDAAALRLNGSWSVELWARPTNAAVATPLLGKGDPATTDGWLIGFDAGGQLYHRRAGITTTLAGSRAVTNLYRHYVLTYDGATLRSYVNGALADTAALAVATGAGTAPMTLAAGAGGHGAVTLDDVSIHARDLTAGEILEHRQCGRRYNEVVLATTGLKSLWRFGEASGTTAVDARGAVNGTYAGPALGAAGALTASENDTAASFDAVDDIVSFGDVYDPVGTAPFSFEAWLRVSSFGTDFRVIAAKHTYDPGRAGWMLTVTPNGTPGNEVLFERFDGSVKTQLHSTSSMTIGTWRHLVVTYDGTRMRMYLDGALESSIASALVIPNITEPLTIGDATWSPAFGGTIDEAAWYDVALPAETVRAHYEAR